jgi:flagellum-specific ATP synthase
VEGDDFNEPVADAVRSILDGHIVLTRELADQGHYPSIDILKSVSRLAGDVCPGPVVSAGRNLVRHLSTFRRVEDMVNIGAYARGSSADIDQALDMIGPIRSFLQQDISERSTLSQAFDDLKKLTGQQPHASVKPRT